jgi:hypothetical protein
MDLGLRSYDFVPTQSAASKLIRSIRLLGKAYLRPPIEYYLSAVVSELIQ